MLHRILTIIGAIAISLSANSQIEKNYELEREMPVFLDQIKEELTYPNPAEHFPDFTIG